MKKYFDFVLTGKKLLPVWLIFYFVVLIPYFVTLVMADNSENPSPLIGLVVILMMLGSFVFYFYLIKISVDNLRYDEHSFSFNGKFSTYIGKVLLGFLLSLITLGVYMAWFMRDIMRYFVHNSSLKSSPFNFLGKGTKLFVILLLTMFPIIILSFIMGDVTSKSDMGAAGLGVTTMLFQVVIMIVMIPYMYYVYKWMVDVEYQGYHIKWNTRFWESCGQIFIQILLTMITLGIYMPMAELKLYKYFVERTVAEKPGEIRNFGFDLNAGSDFLFLWGQILLTLATAGIYYPWAFAAIGKRFLSRTWLTSSAVQIEPEAILPPPLPVND